MKFFYFALLLILFSGCANLNSLQGGKTLPKDTFEITPIVGLGTFEEAENFYEDRNEFVAIPNCGLRVKYGFTDKIDAGITADLSSNFGLTGKYHVLGKKNSKFNSSIGFDFGANLIVFSYGTLLYYYSVPLYFSYDFKSTFSFYLTPRYINNSGYRIISRTNKNSSNDISLNRATISYGALFGKKHKFGLEISNNSKNLLIPTQIAFGYNIRF